MRFLLSIISLVCALSISAGMIKIGNDNALTWDDQTESIQYNNYRVVVRLNKAVNYNVWGEVTLTYQGRTIQTKPLFISAGETSGHAGFENLDNGRRYTIVVKINNK